MADKVGEQLRNDCIISNSKEQEHPYGVRHAWRRPPLEVDHAVAEIDQQLKVRVVDVSNCYTRYCPSNLSCCSSQSLSPMAQRRPHAHAARDAVRRHQGWWPPSGEVISCDKQCVQTKYYSNKHPMVLQILQNTVVFTNCGIPWLRI